ncbi:MAG: basic amino acid ABC transporter substrate-binding protein [Chloroflexota bacterium]
MPKRATIVMCVAAILVLVLSACGSPTPTTTPAPLATTVPSVVAADTAVPAATAAPTSAPVATMAATPAADIATMAASPEATMAATDAAMAASPEATMAATTAVMAASPEATMAVTEVAMAASPTVAAATMAPTAVVTAAATTEVAAAPAATQEVLLPAPSTMAECKSTGVLSVGTDATYPPFENVNDSGKIVGFDIDLLTAIGAKAGFTIAPRNALFDTIFVALSRSQYDLVISASTITAERQQTVNFSNPYFVAGQVIVLRKADLGKIKTTDDLAGKTIGVQLGTTGAEAAKGIKNVKEVKEYGTAPEAFQALSNGTVDAVVNDNVTSLSIILNSPTLNLAVVGQPFTEEYYGIAIRKDCTDLLKKINDGLAQVIADGTYADIYTKYLGEEPGDAFKKGGAGVPAVAAPTAVATDAAMAASPEATMAASPEATMAATP